MSQKLEPAQPESPKQALHPEVTGGEPRELRAPWQDSLRTLIVLALLWELASWWTPDYVVPGWALIARSLWRLLQDHPGWIALTCGRVLAALMVGFLAGAGLAIGMYRHPRLERYLVPLIRVLMAVPVICWILFAVLWFSGTEFRISLVLVLVCAPIFLIDLLDAMKGVPRDWLEMVRCLRPGPVDLFRALILPAVWPAVLTSWKVNLSLAIRVVTIAELVGATSGIGYGLTVAQSQLSIADIFAWTLILVAILLVAQQLVGWLERRSLRWRAA